MKILIYQYNNSDILSQTLAGFGGAVVGPLGAIGGELLGKNAVKRKRGN